MSNEKQYAYNAEVLVSRTERFVVQTIYLGRQNERHSEPFITPLLYKYRS
ncbi:hypothetical protein [Scopulibacillus daqui]|nr:hypothetical protein [Scopulibacillus daqui]